MPATRRYHLGSKPFWITGIVIALCWAASITWLRSETRTRVPSLERPVSYSSLLPTDPLGIRYGIMAGQSRIGDLTYAVIPRGTERRITWQIRLSPEVGDHHTQANATGSSLIDSTGCLASFEAELMVESQRFQVVGAREQDILTVTYSGFGHTRARVMQVDSTLAVGDGFFPGFVAGCPPSSERLVWKVFDPLTRGASEIRVEQSHQAVSPPAPQGGCVLAVTFKGLTTLMWVDSEGVVVRQRTPVGWEIVMEGISRDPEFTASADWS